MKKLLRIGLVVAGLFMVGNVANAQQKFAHINSADLLGSMPEMKTAEATFMTFQKAKQTALELMDAERVKKINLYNDKTKALSEANKDVLGKEIDALVKEIQDMEKRINDTQEKSQEELTTKRTELYQPIFQKAEDAVKVVAKEKGFAYVFDISQPGVIYFDGGEDLLAAVKAKLGITTASK